jgi:hypothetical protein
MRASFYSLMSRGVTLGAQVAVEWTSRTSAADNIWVSVTYGNGLFVAVARSGTGNRVMTSPDGINWTIRTSAADNTWRAITYGEGLFVAVASTGTDRIMTSPDGINWTIRTVPTVYDFRAITYGNGIFVATNINGSGERIISSVDGITWVNETTAVDNWNWYGIAYGAGLFVAVAKSGTGDGLGTDERVMTSPDGSNWTLRTAPNNNWESITFANGMFVAVAGTGTDNRVMTSPDGINWTQRTSAADNYWVSVTYGDGLFVAVGLTGTLNRIMTSPDGITWTLRTTPVDNIWESITYGNGIFAAVSSTGTDDRVMTSGAFSAGSYYDRIIAGAPFAYWRLGESSGTVAVDEISANNGTYIGSPTLEATSLVPSDLVNKAVQNTTTNAFTSQGVIFPLINPASISISLIVSGAVSTGESQARLCGNGLGSVNLPSYAITYNPNGTIIWSLYSQNGVTNSSTITSTSTFAANTPIHIVATFDNTTKDQSLYINGVLEATTNWAGFSFWATTDVFSLGYQVEGASGKTYPFTGSMDELAIWDRALTQSEITAQVELYGYFLSGIGWTSRTSAADNDWIGVTYGNGLFVAVSYTGSGNRVMTSPDGINWTTRTSAADNFWIGVAYGNGIFVAVSAGGGGDSFMSSPDGINWTTRASPGTSNWSEVTFGNGLFVAVGQTLIQSVATSPDGITWTSRTSAADNFWNGVTYGNGLFVAVAGTGAGNRVQTSPDGITWTSRVSANDVYWDSVAYGNGIFVAVAEEFSVNSIMTSPDGINWTSRVSPVSNPWLHVAFGDGLFVAVSNDGTGDGVITSPDGINWTVRASASDNSWSCVAYGGGLFAAVSNDGTGDRVMTSGEVPYTYSSRVIADAPIAYWRLGDKVLTDLSDPFDGEDGELPSRILYTYPDTLAANASILSNKMRVSAVGGSLRSTQLISGNFDIVIEWDRGAGTWTQEVSSTGISLWGDGGDSFSIYTQQKANGNNMIGKVDLGSPAYTQIVDATTLGFLRINKTGTLVTNYYKINSGDAWINVSSGTTSDTLFYFTFFVGADAGTIVDWNNVVVTADTIDVRIINDEISVLDLVPTDVSYNQPSLILSDLWNTSIGFNGTTSTSVNTGTNNALTITGDLTVSFAMSVSNLNTSQVILIHSKQTTGEGNNTLYEFYLGTDGKLVWIHEYGDSIALGEAFNFTFLINNGYLITITRTVSDKTYRMYVDGVFVASSVYTFDPTGGSLSDFTLGSNRGGGDKFTGTLDEVAIYNKVLSPSEITAQYNASIA